METSKYPFILFTLILIGTCFSNSTLTAQSYRRNNQRYRSNTTQRRRQQGQSSCYPQNKTYGTLTLGFGSSPLKTIASSPSVSYHYTQKDVNTGQVTNGTFSDSIKIYSNSKNRFTAQLGFEVGKKDGIYGDIQFGIMNGQADSYYTNLGIGYNLTHPDYRFITFRPSVSYTNTESDYYFSNTIDNYYKNVTAFDTKFSYYYVHHSKYSSTTVHVKTLGTKLRIYEGGARVKMGVWLFPQSKCVVRFNVGYIFLCTRMQN
jgi:hypothetical protein